MSDPRPYTYVTLSMEPQATPRLNVAFYTADLRVRAGLLGNPRPYLEISSDEGTVSISTTGGGHVTDADLNTARQFFNAAARYLADCERLHNEQSAKAATDAA
ncbi:hypothetical protein EDD27_8965 [Nonomuraea polychroma]|uniref:Uncharacterized protein n=1 Tax=Nonomuraea polychroma TaxID=46176 RepID=A0A438MKG8_9ACTN|nr:hypothetical protein [Nonomuraea polychroma]RVX46115.1 hypothetical protein EDD27_8965 [Nonomuraea polychroma]